MAQTLPYILVDEFGILDANGLLVSGIMKAVQDALKLPVLNYQYGYIDELNETLEQYALTQQFDSLKYPLVWLAQPFRVKREDPLVYGETKDAMLFFIHQTSPEYKAKDRMKNIFKPTLYPLYLETLNQIKLSSVFDNAYSLPHEVVDYYFYGDEESGTYKGNKSHLNDVIDCLQVTNLKLKINHKCSTGLG